MKKHRLVAFFLVLILSFTSIAGGLDIYAATPKPQTTDSFVSTELEISQYWTFSISGTVITATLFDSEAAQGANTLLGFVEDDSYDTWGTISSGKSTMSINVKDLSDGFHMLRLYEARQGDSSGKVTSLADYQLQIRNGSPLFYFPGGETETSFRDGFLDYNPLDYDGIPAFAEEISNLNAITSFSESLVSGINSDKEKVKVIHDWLATNIAYDYESLYSGDTQDAADPNVVFETHLAVCSGYARLARIMFGAVGIPCLNIHGYINNEGVQADTVYDASNHEWNAVYVDGGWKLLDITWDSVNIYYGEGDEGNTSGQPPIYAYYGVSPLLISSDHVSISMYNFKDRTSDLAPADTGEYNGFTYKVFHNGTVGIIDCSLTGDIVIPSEINGKKVTNLADSLFFGKDEIISVTIPETVTYFGEDMDDNKWDYVFSYCFNLERIDVASGNKSFVSVDGVLFNKDKTILYSYPCSKAGAKYHVPATVNYLACASFASAKNLQDLYIEGADTEWATYTFYNDTSLNVHYYPGGDTENFVQKHIDEGLSGADNNYATFVKDSIPSDHKHTLVATPAKDATETKTGNSAYWTCLVCKKHFSDADGQNEIEQNSWIIPVLVHVHSLTVTPAKDATCTQAGSRAYWTCSGCKKYFSDADGQTEIKKDSWIIPAAGHKYVTDASIPATYTKTGLTEGRHCSVCGEVQVKQDIIPILKKLPQPMRVKAGKKTVYYSKLKKKAQKVSPITVKNAAGKLTYTITGGKKKSKKALKINGKNGKITVKKKTKAGTYTVKVKVSAAGSEQYKPGSKSVKVTVTVK